MKFALFVALLAGLSISVGALRASDDDTIHVSGIGGGIGRGNAGTPKTKPSEPAAVDDGIPAIIKQLDQFAYENLMVNTPTDTAAMALTPGQSARIATAARAHDARRPSRRSSG